MEVPGDRGEEKHQKNVFLNTTNLVEGCVEYLSENVGNYATGTFITKSTKSLPSGKTKRKYNHTVQQFPVVNNTCICII